MRFVPDRLCTMNDVRTYLTFYVNGSYGMYLDSKGRLVVIVPKKAYADLAKDIAKKCASPGAIIVRKNSLWQELKLLFFRLRGY